MKTCKSVSYGKPDAGNPHVRFDEGEVAPAAPRRGSLLYNINITLFAAVFLTGSLFAHNIIPSPKEYKEGEGFNVSGQVSYVADAALGKEAYRIKVAPDKIEVFHGDAAGKFYAGQTLAQMKTEKGYPVAEVSDAPKFHWRGIMVDESRHFFGKQAILKLLKLMGRYKYNTFHWHLNDDGGFREPFEFDPKMAKEGATRPFKKMLDVKGTTDWDPNPNMEQKAYFDKVTTGPDYGPFSYSVADIKEILACAEEQHIRVIPELEIPGHATGLLRAHPEFCCLDKDGKPLDPNKCMEICVGNPDVMAWYDKAFDVTFDLFPGDIVHVGGDEVNPKHWNDCPRCKKFREEHGLKTWEEQQAWVTQHVWERARKRGKRIMGWGALYYQHAPKDTIICCANEVRMASAVADGYEVVRTDDKIFNFDWSQGLKNDPYQYIAWRPHVSTFESCWYEHMSCDLPEDRQHRMLGAMGCCWAEFIRDPKDLEWKIWPRALALVENLWKHGGNPVSGRYPEFRARAERHIKWLRDHGVNCAPLRDSVP